MRSVRFALLAGSAWLMPVSSALAQDANAIAFATGALLQQVIEKCDVAVTTTQRNAVTRKVEALRNEVPPRVAQEAVAKLGANFECPPTPRDRDETLAAMAAFIEKTPQQLVEFLGTPSGAAAAPAPAAQPSVTSVAGWQVDLGKCTIYRDYKDPDDKNAFNAIVMGRSRDGVVISLEYENWRRTRGEQIRAKMSVDDVVVSDATTWTSPNGGTAMAARFDNSVLPFLMKGQELELGFNNVTADFKMPGVGQALAALEGCAR